MLTYTFCSTLLLLGRWQLFAVGGSFGGPCPFRVHKQVACGKPLRSTLEHLLSTAILSAQNVQLVHSHRACKALTVALLHVV